MVRWPPGRIGWFPCLQDCLITMTVHITRPLFFCGFRSSASGNKSGPVPLLSRGGSYSQLKSCESKVDNILTKVTTLSINLNIDGVPIVSRSDTHPSLANHSTLIRVHPLLGWRTWLVFCRYWRHRVTRSRFADTIEYVIFTQTSVIA